MMLDEPVTLSKRAELPCGRTRESRSLAERADAATKLKDKVQTSALKTALDDILERKPHLKASPGRPAGDGDGGKGDGAAGDADDMSVDEHLKRVQART
jgi:hypothetical protein